MCSDQYGYTPGPYTLGNIFLHNNEILLSILFSAQI